MKTRCYTCYGSGAEVERDCRACEGTGRALHNMDFPCDKCKGTGDDDVQCKDCKGTGQVDIPDVLCKCGKPAWRKSDCCPACIQIEHDSFPTSQEPSDMDEDARNWVDEG
jgi:DnaJ-class molecular chaperone